ncbi:MAG: (2Fe-2S) ferredoxin domain-containing protein [Pelatocladus maniniholoensis HA4357-MV3]|jgi:(2Fe-2S) ferredoxin|uniref:(2Fe-2S) ferredoxin domain-containing protein n=1 Tax=Pelatocladus maniniholoensis HA4357-MV3 TaxID=1117104 RepID=A0A9E3H7K9_9NOST|nr:(2Fe-2S) ferredoxin domain-containing protein [Pelatocladus maniniholoensis HA4357-MV3]
MSHFHNTETTAFCMEARFLDFVIKDGYKLKGLLLATPDGECYVKLAKHLRAGFDWRLPRGTWLQVVGEKKCDRKTGEVKFKAERILAASFESHRYAENLTPPPQQSTTSSIEQSKPKVAKSTILVCQKSDCMKRGGKQVCQAIQAAMSDRGLEDQVTIKGTGCMKNCKAGPNLVMPDKTRYSRIKAAQVPALIDKHFSEVTLAIASNNTF